MHNDLILRCFLPKYKKKYFTNEQIFFVRIIIIFTPIDFGDAKKHYPTTEKEIK